MNNEQNTAYRWQSKRSADLLIAVAVLDAVESPPRHRKEHH